MCDLLNITVYCGSNPGNKEVFANAALTLGSWIGESGNTLVYGGSSVGLMGILSKAVMDSGGRAIGVEPKFFIDAGVAQHDLNELYVVETMNERKAKMIELGDVFVALPGGIGTLEEITEIMTRVRLNLTTPPCFLLNLDGYYEPLKAMLRTMVDADLMPGFRWSDYRFPESTEELIAEIEALPEQRTSHVCADEWEQPDWVSREASYIG